MQHVADHGLSYGTLAEFNFRQQIFNDTHREIIAINSQPGITSTTGHNFLSTWTKSEKKRLLGYKPMPAGEQAEVEEELEGSGDHPTTVNWVTAGAVTPVKNQASCGSCWSFSTTGALEGAHFIKKGELVSFSEEQLVQCVPSSFYCSGCNGGSMEGAFKWLQSNAIVTEAQYPYTSGRGVTGTCNKTLAAGGKVNVTKYKNVPADNSKTLRNFLEKGPVSVAIEADRPVFTNYTSGVITGSACGTQLDHGVLAVGFGVENGQNYFLVKNSWGATWGDAGYVKIGWGDGMGVCGINHQATRPTSN
jgi:C1A family cysteine protease